MPADTRVSAPSNGEAGDLLEHWQGVYLVALRITNDSHAAEDIAQETYLKAIAESRKRLPDNPRTWLFCIAANLARNWQRDKHTHQRLETGMKTTNMTVEQPANDAALALRERFKNLDESYRLALSLHYEQGLTFREVAKVIGKPEGTASSLITRGLDALRQALARDGHTVAPAIIVAELQNLGGATLARPEVLAAIKSALLAKSGAAAALGAGAGAGAKAAAGISSALLAGGVVIATVAIGLGIDHHFRAAPPPLPSAAPAVVGPVQPVGGGGTQPANPPAVAERYFDSAFKFEVFAEDGRTSLGHTPYWNERGIRVPSEGLWYVTPLLWPQNAAGVVTELNEKHVSGLTLMDAEVTAKDAEKLAGAPNLRMLRLSTKADIEKQLEAFTKIEHLALSGKGITDQTVTAFDAMPQLTVLDLGRSAITDAGLSRMAEVNLKELVLCDTAVSMTGLKPRLSMPLLHTLDVRATAVTEKDILDNIGAFSPSLRKLSLGGNEDNLTNLEKIRQALPKVRVNGWEAYEDELAKKRIPIEQEEKDVLLKLASAAPGADLGIPADPEMHDVLNDRKFTLEMVDMPLGQAVGMMAAHAETRMVIDPQTESSAAPNLNLRVASMPCELHLQWMLKLADLDYRIYGRIVVIGAHTAKNPQSKTFDLPVAKGEQPWTAEETVKVAQLLATWPIQSSYGPDGYQFESFGIPATADGRTPGKLVLTARSLSGADEFLDGFSDAPPMIAIPAGYRAMERALEQKVVLKSAAPTVSAALRAFNAATQINVFIDPKLETESRIGAQKFAQPWPKPDARAFEAIVDLCARFELHACPWVDAIVLTGKDYTNAGVIRPVMLNLEPALKRGVNEQELESRLSELIKDTTGELNVKLSHVLRGRWLAQTDPWTAHRAAAIVDEAAKAGKVSAAPPAPWFFATFKNSGKPPVAPAKDDRSPGDQDGF